MRTATRPRGVVVKAVEATGAREATVAAGATEVVVLILVPRPASSVTDAIAQAISSQIVASHLTPTRELLLLVIRRAGDRKEVVVDEELSGDKAIRATMFVPWVLRKIITKIRPWKRSLKAREITISGAGHGSLLRIDSLGAALRRFKVLDLSTSTSQRMKISFLTLSQSLGRSPIPLPEYVPYLPQEFLQETPHGPDLLH